MAKFDTSRRTEITEFDIKPGIFHYAASEIQYPV